MQNNIIIIDLNVCQLCLEMAVESVQGRLSRLYSSHHRTYLYGDDQAEDQPATEETIENKKEKDVEEGLEN